jgi:hypothetical protein
MFAVSMPSSLQREKKRVLFIRYVVCVYARMHMLAFVYVFQVFNM